MTNLTISINDLGNILTWAAPDPAPGPAPFAEWVAQDTTEIASKLNTDEQMIALVFTLPKNYVHKLVELRIWGDFASTGDVRDVSNGITCRGVDSPLVGPAKNRKPFFMVTKPIVAGAAADVEAFDSAFTSADEEFTKIWEVDHYPGQFIGPQGNSGAGFDSPAIQGFLFNNSSTVTTPWQIHWYCRTLMFTVDQVNKFPVHQSVPVTAA